MAALVVMLVVLWAIAAATGWADDLDIERIRSLVLSSSGWGVLVYIAVFAGAELAHIPGMVFVLAGIAIWGRTEGLLIAYIGANMSVITSFVVVRTVGGKTLQTIENKWLKKALVQLEKRPLATVIAVRILFWLAPAANYLLALSPVRLVHFIVGSALGLLPPIALVSWLFEWAMATFA